MLHSGIIGSGGHPGGVQKMNTGSACSGSWTEPRGSPNPSSASRRPTVWARAVANWIGFAVARFGRLRMRTRGSKAERPPLNFGGPAPVRWGPGDPGSFDGQAEPF